MDQDTGTTREGSQDEERFWIDTERQYFINPNPSLITCLRNHAWHCRYIASRSRRLLSEREDASTYPSTTGPEVKRPKTASSTGSLTAGAIALSTNHGGPTDVAGHDRIRDGGIVSVRFRVKNKPFQSAGGHYTDRGMYKSAMVATGVSDLMMDSDEYGYASNIPRLSEYEDDIYYNPVVNAKHDGKLKLPVIFPSQAPDGMRIVLYCPDEKSRHVDLGISRRPGFKTSMLNDMLSPDQVPEIISGPAPVWSHTIQPTFKDGKDAEPAYKKMIPRITDINGPVIDPVWVSHNDHVSTRLTGSSALLRHLALTDVSPPCPIDYSPKLFTFVESKGSPLCRRCLGMAKVACPLCTNMDITNHIPGVSFSNPMMVDHKYELVFNGLDVCKARALMGTEDFRHPNPGEELTVSPLNKSNDDDITALLKEYVDTLEEIDSTVSTLLERVDNERKPNFDYWSKVESRMIKSYIEQYNNKMMDNRYTYNTQRQSFDVLRIRLTCEKSSELPSQWTDHALCSICGSDEDWDDDPILFCDCCYIPMHYCCLGYKPATMGETMKANIRRHTLLHTAEGEEPNIDDDEWMCPCCLFLLDQLGFLEENMALKAIRIAAGPRNKQAVDIFRNHATPDETQAIDIARLPYVVGFEYDNPQERIDLCTVYRRIPSACVSHGGSSLQGSVTTSSPTQSNESSASSSVTDYQNSGKLTLNTLIECGNIPTTMAFNFPDEDIDAPFDCNLKEFETDVLGRTITQFWSFKGMTKTQLDIARDIFDDLLVRHMSDGCLDGMVKILKFLPPEEENMDIIIRHDRESQLHKPSQPRRGRKPNELKMENQQNGAVRVSDQQIMREDIYTINSKNPLKRLVISVRLAKNFFVNLKIPVCVFCGFDAYYPGGGPMKRTSHPGTWAHVRCAIAVECVITPKEIDYSTFVPKVKALKCMVCHNTSTAILQCSHGNCCKAFHVSCAAASSCCLFTWDQNGKPDILCPQHASGLAPTVLLRKLQAKVQYKNYKKMSTYESSLDGVNPKDDVYLTHFLEPNYRSVASMIEQVFGLEPRTGFPIPLCGDEVLLKNPLPERDTSDKNNTMGDNSASRGPNESMKPGDSKTKFGKRCEIRLPLRDKSGKFKVSDKNKDAPRHKQAPSSALQQPSNVPVCTDPSVSETPKQTPEANISRDIEQNTVYTNPGAEMNSEIQPSSAMFKPPVLAAVVPAHDPQICRITQLAKQECFWCSIGNDDVDEYSHYRVFYDDRCPTVDHVGNLLFPDFASVQRKCSEILDAHGCDSKIPLEDVPALVWSEICASSRIVDDKMLYFISDDFIGGQRLISEVVSKSCRNSLLGLTRLLNIVYFKSKRGNDMPTIFERLLNHMKTVQSVDEARRNCEIGTNSATDVFTPLNPMANDFPGPHAVSSSIDHRKECRARVKAVLSTLNQSIFLSIDSKLLPNAILRMAGGARSSEPNDEANVSRRFAVCSGCLEFKTIDQYMDEFGDTGQKSVLYAYHYKTCRMCSARACNDCILHMRSASPRKPMEPPSPPFTPTQPSAEVYMSAASMLSQPVYHRHNPMVVAPRPSCLEDNTVPSVRDAVINMPLVSRGQVIDPMGCHPPRGIGVGTPMNVDSRMAAIMPPGIQRGHISAPCTAPGGIPLPIMGPSIPMMNPNIGEMPLMPMCNMMPKAISAPGICGPMFNNTGGKTIPGMNDRGLPPSAICGGSFGKAGPMIKSPPIKNGPYVTHIGSQLPKESSSMNGGFSGPSDTDAGVGVIAREDTIDGDDSNIDTFICARCEDMENDINIPLLCCALCSRFDGLMIPINKEYLSFCPNWTSEYCGYSYVHIVCLDWLTYSKSANSTLRKFPKALFEYPCHYCGVACGATMLCTNNYCNVRFHASCGAWLGCKADMGKRLESSSSSSRRVYCLRHTLLNMTRMSQAERKFLLAPSNLYELLIATKYHLSGFFAGVYLSRYCVPNKMKSDPSARPAIARIPTNLTSKRPKASSKGGAFPINNINAAVNMLNGINYMNLGMVLSKTNFGQAINEYNLLPDNIARDRLIQALNWTAYNSMNLVGGRRDSREIKVIIQLIKAGQLKPIQGSKRGRKPKSLDGSNFDNRQKMPMEDILTYCHSGQLDSGEFFCPVCFSIYFERSPGMPGDDLHWIGCDGCERWFHFVCAGVWAEGQVDANSPSWFCLACTRQRHYRVHR